MPSLIQRVLGGEKSRSRGPLVPNDSDPKHTFVGIREHSLPNLIRLKEIVGRLTILYFSCSAEPDPASVSPAEWDAPPWSKELVQVCSHTGMKHLYDKRQTQTCHIYGYNYRESALRHTSVIYGLLTLLSHNLFQLLQQIQQKQADVRPTQ